MTDKRAFEAPITESEYTLLGALLILCWETGKLSEGQVSRVLKTDRMTIRTERDRLIEIGMTIFKNMRGQHEQ